MKEKIDEVRKLAEEKGRTVQFGIRLHVIVRETEEEAWEEAERLIQYVDNETIELAQKHLQDTIQLVKTNDLFK